MPKTRGSNTVATGGHSRTSTAAGGFSGGSDGITGEAPTGGNLSFNNTEMVNRMEDRLQEARTIAVSMESRTRGRLEDIQVTFTPENHGHASVLSESGQTYDVDYENGTCTCMHYTMRESGCRHIDAVNLARGQLTEDRAVNNREINNSDIQGIIAARSNMDVAEEAERRNLTNNFEDDNFFYSDNDELFRSELERLTYEDLPYEHENVLNGSQNTFGIELEFVGGDADAIARELYDMGICAYNYRVGYHSQGVQGKWKLESDGSVSSGLGGGELVSPVLKDTPETWQTIEKVCEVAKRHGAQINGDCGGHVHMSMEPLDTARQRWRRMFNTIGSFEECIYRLAGGDLGEMRETYYARPFSDRAASTSTSRFTMETADDVNRLARNASDGLRYYGVNLTNIYDSRRPNTVEFRYFNGSLNPAQIQANIKIANGIMIASEKARTKDLDSEQTSDSMKKRGTILKEASGSNQRSDSQMKKFVDIIFMRKKDKDNILSVYGKNSWR
ncbi:amidoligase family protein [Clostridium sp. 19966]|uniref:amidoligase family protein n=1 Tax=Clostridium sp. 19966 TaxID=2768166 RepID=UPI0028DF4CFB|nr:amidoligase family protein [Clostridium sp. 19966]MDT8718277.1 amidoligase family protein [Clostridium sp. 19966]